ncbi:MAG: hypothetical protein HQL46_14875 [Gammaproteobacteria bacterium]|nr:hypothetical protein [Gammaproteobacteria bacterium]
MKKNIFIFFSFTFFFLIFFSSNLLATQSQSCGSDWQWSNPSPQGKTLRHVIWSNEQRQYVAVGEGGTIMTSDNGDNWQVQPLLHNETINAIVWNGQQYIAVYEDGTIISSANGINWSKQNSPVKNSLKSIIWTGDKYIAVGGDGVIISSDNGINWQQQSSGIDDVLNDIIYAASVYVAVGENGRILSSSDAINWQNHSSNTTLTLHAINWNGKQFLIGGGDWNELLNNYQQISLISSNAQNWQLTQITASPIFDIIWDGKQYLSASDYNHVLSSTDGIVWNSSSFEGSESFLSMVWNGEQYLAVGINGIIYTSSDGNLWSKKTSGVTISFYHIFWDEFSDSFYTSGDGVIYKSKDGFAWEALTINVDMWGQLHGMASDGQQNLFIGHDLNEDDKEVAVVLKTADNLFWSKAEIALGRLNSIVWHDNVFIAVGKNENDKGVIYSSSNGTSWSLVHSADAELNSVVYVNGQFMSVGANGILLRSSNGIDWLTLETSSTETLNNISWNNETYVIVGNNELILSSTDGESWTRRLGSNSQNLEQKNLYDIIWNGSKFLIVGGPGNWGEAHVLSSFDAISWQTETVSANSLNSIAWDGQQLLAVGIGGSIINSICYQGINFQDTRAIIIAGGGDPDDPLWEATNNNANYAYQTLRAKGISRDNIRYLNALSGQDVDGDGDFTNDITSAPTSAIIEESLLNWAGSQINETKPLLIYLLDHGGKNIFYVSKPKQGEADILFSSSLGSWLNTLQEQTNARITTIYDACNSGSFISDLKLPDGKSYERINIFSSQADQLANFAARGRISFSSFFWAETLKGYNVKSAFRSAQVAMQTATGNENNEFQKALLDDNGDGLFSKVDGSLAEDTHLGRNAITATVFPRVYEVQNTVTINADESVELYAKTDLPNSLIERTWAVVSPPNAQVFGSEPITDLQEIELSYDEVNNKYTGNISGFTENGRYTLSYFTQSKEGSSSFPTVSFINVSGVDTSQTSNHEPSKASEVIANPVEGNSNYINYFLLQLSKPLNEDIRVDFQTQNGTAISGQDYIETSGTATIKAGKTITVIPVTILGDTIAELDETFYLNLSNPQGISFPSGQTTIQKMRTIVNDD